jgi:hypothetical protein
MPASAWDFACAVYAVAAIVFVAIVAFRASIVDEGGPAVAVARILGALTLPATALALVHAFWWPVSIAASAAIAAAWLNGARQFRLRRPAISLDLIVTLATVALALAVVATRAALSIAAPPYDFDSALYHLPMTAELLQTHTAVPAQFMYHPAASELLMALGVGAFDSFAGKAVPEAIVVIAFVLAAYGFAHEAGGRGFVPALAACAALSVPFTSDMIFTAENDVLVAALLLAFVALWQRHPFASMIVAGIAAGVKFTAPVEIVAMLPFLWQVRSPALSWPMAAAGLVTASPWYIRNAIETGNPFFLGGQTGGIASTILGQGASALGFAALAVRNYGGLLSVAGFVAGISGFLRRRTAQAPLAGAGFAAALAVLAVWLIIPNGAVAQGIYDQIQSGWSIRYVLFSLSVLSMLAVLWIGRASVVLAALATCVSLAFALKGSIHQAAGIDPGIFWYVAPLGAILAGGLACTMIPPRWSIPLAATVALSLTVVGWFGTERIARQWNAAYARFGGHSYAGLLQEPALQRSTSIATIVLTPLPLMGARFDRYATGDVSGLPPDAWLRLVLAKHTQIVFAADVRGHMDNHEILLARSRQFEKVADDNGTRVYVAVARHRPAAPESE